MKKLFALQHRIYKSLQVETDRLLGEQPPAIQAYERNYDRDFQKSMSSLRPAKKEELINATRKSDITFIADFHTFRQAQRTALRIVREAVRPGETWWLGLELIPSHYQSALDDFQSGRIDLETFHETIHYDDEWGFPWKNYAPLFEWARENQIPLIALNRPKELFLSSASLRRAKHDTELQKRDQWAAGIITDLFSRTPRSKAKPRMIVLYGELHLASRHLPRQLALISKDYLGRPLKSLCIHQNVDRIYWYLARKNKEHQANVLRLRKNRFCVLSSTPWTKLQSLVTWAEGSASETIHEHDALLTDDLSTSFQDPIDYLFLMRTYGQAIAEFLNIAPAAFESLTLKTIQDADFVDSLEKEGLFSNREIRMIRYHVASNQRIYIPRVNIAYLGSPSQNRAAELAAIHLFRARAHIQEIFESKIDTYFRLIIESSFGFLGSLLLNPRRKCDLYEDHIRRLKHLRNSKRRLDRIESVARKLSLKMLGAERDLLRGRPFRAPLLGRFIDSDRLAPAAMLSARFLGQILGKKLHQALIAEIILPKDIRQLCLTCPKGAREPYREAYLTLLRLCAPARLGPTKQEVL